MYLAIFSAARCPCIAPAVCSTDRRAETRGCPATQSESLPAQHARLQSVPAFATLSRSNFIRRSTPTAFPFNSSDSPCPPFH